MKCVGCFYFCSLIFLGLPLRSQADAREWFRCNVPHSAVTVVGLRTSDDGSASLLAQESLEDDEIALWLEIPRVAPETVEAGE